MAGPRICHNPALVNEDELTKRASIKGSNTFIPFLTQMPT